MGKIGRLLMIEGGCGCFYLLQEIGEFIGIGFAGSLQDIEKEGVILQHYGLME
jgi:hypothetical protein